MTRGLAGRAALAVAALLVVVWLGLSLRSAHLEQDAAEKAFQPGRRMTAEQEAVVQRSADRARLLNPSTRIDLVLATVYVKRGQMPRAIATVEDAVRREPESFEAWELLSRIAADPAERARARAEVRRLNPLLPAPR